MCEFFGINCAVNLTVATITGYPMFDYWIQFMGVMGVAIIVLCVPIALIVRS